jgi:Methylene-tetrahydrofolate reductase C terminal
MYRVRLFANRHARGFEWAYCQLERALVALDPLFRRIGYDRIERPVAFVERVAKGLLFDCRMCGQCVLSSTGMSCPMNCPKQLRNGPCGGVRPGGFCEVRPEMRCVWVLAWGGASRMQGGQRIREVLPPVDRRLEGSSAWLRVAREKALALRTTGDTGDTRRATLARAFRRARDIEPASAPLAEEPPRATAGGTHR